MQRHILFFFSLEFWRKCLCLEPGAGGAGTGHPHRRVGPAESGGGPGGILRGLSGPQPRGLRPGRAVPRPHRRRLAGGPGGKGAGHRREDPALRRHPRHHIVH